MMRLEDLNPGDRFNFIGNPKHTYIMLGPHYTDYRNCAYYNIQSCEHGRKVLALDRVFVVLLESSGKDDSIISKELD